MIRKYFNHTLQTHPRRREEEPQNTNSHRTSGKQIKQNNQLYLFLIKMIAKLGRTQSNESTKNPHTRYPNSNLHSLHISKPYSFLIHQTAYSR